MDDARGSAERVALVALLRTRPGGRSWSALMADVVEAGSALEVLRGGDQLSLIGDPATDLAYVEAEQVVAKWDAAGLRMLTVLDKDYPERLLGIHQAPPFLFAEGLLLRDDPAVSVVGSRKASSRGLAIARDIASALAREGFTVVAGLAAGIDTAAHVAALDVLGRTVAVIGTGITKCYPAANRDLQRAIGERGLVLSQFFPDAPPQQHNFPMRNVTMSGYGIATVVVEAGEHSGARIQARVAVEHGRPVILTDLVVERTDWGKALVGRPGVYVAAGTQDVLATVRRLHVRLGSIGADLERLAAV